MPDDNQQWLNPRPPANLPGVPSDRPKPPAPPPPEITIRTMQSDADSLRQSGGAGPTPKSFTPPLAPPLPPPPLSKITPSDFTAPKTAEKPTVSIIEEENKSGSSGSVKKLLKWAGALAIAILVGVAGYLYIFPLLFPTQAPPPPPAVTLPTQTETPANTAVPEIPAAAAPHKSLLNASDAIANAELAAIDPASLSNALQQEVQKSNPAGFLAELILGNAGGQVSASALLLALAPELTADVLKSILEEDFTMALYYDENGMWPAYILKLKAEASQVEAQTEINKLEFSSNLKNFFAVDPGAPGAAFKTGQAEGIATRYLAYSKKGAAFNIAWSGDKLVISTSYNGLKKILTSL